MRGRLRTISRLNVANACKHIAKSGTDLKPITLNAQKDEPQKLPNKSASDPVIPVRTR